MGTRKAPTGPRHAFCNVHEAYAGAPGGWMCFMDKRTTEDDVLARMIFVDEIAVVAAAHHAAELERLALAPTGVGIGTVGKADTAVWAKAATPSAYQADLGTIAEAVSFADYTDGEAVAA